jgi:type IV secretory pathway VirB10-like protein
VADGAPLATSGPDEPERPDRGMPSEPPPLTDIRVKAPRAKGLNKPAIVAAAGGGAAIVLVLASGAFSSDPSRKPAETKPMMSDPARPEMAKGAVRELPATYSEARAFAMASDPAMLLPQLGPPLPGDVAAFAPQSNKPYGAPPSADWGEPPAYGASPGHSPYVEEEDPVEIEARQADRSALFFSMRQESPGQPAPQAAQQLQQSRTPGQLTAIGRRQNDPITSSLSPAPSLHPGAVIPASLITELNSESPGPVIAQVTQSIYDSPTGRALLIPQGARLIGDYRSTSKYGQSRVAILWSRLIMPDGEEVELNESAVDPSGAAGVAGKVDNHWGDVFGAAALGTLINIGVATIEEPQLTYGGIGVVNRDPIDDALNDGVQRGASIVSNRVVDRGLAIPPTIRIESGTRISVIVTRKLLIGA